MTDSLFRAITNKDVKNLLRKMNKSGFDMDVRKSKHLRIVAPDGSVYFTGITSGDSRAVKELRKWAENHGLERVR